ncbi:nucleosome assembly protein, putative [Entamoeba histolytica HM-1:IMSS-B]|uniref:Nucleosome assembly protein, putative n=6 Tax=Entamoeba histolytica TaxID=5759 RepID=C4M608_ENTH1|nr:nucleosome assembly protein, putative [Entamoeba histolytica HM-1:IMSS]EMD49731.1 nucleosome assembly protein, putative [Entamoeba histolytica KU27]EMH76258.1 nucleosome assembly protein, putative [Entamoeba histolytica HM-1:IMSS-B]EMS17938.1 nucleosome assembly protein, putative [Entamoeba histolytica HM-3:IMSS]ENY61227.1 nucleosome assembly protein, putative [Entamoeba histolytica HM-1:IMSS-A]GAT96882.1 nucleosome assembly protein putative [Entamoeba histolytica]|eukprot:XP_653463.1 nucleosome assembly protein, putative [Entamoeba histolytica HM-1:IMSS]
MSYQSSQLPEDESINRKLLQETNRSLKIAQAELTVKKVYKTMEYEKMMKILNERRKDVVVGLSDQKSEESQQSKPIKNDDVTSPKPQINNKGVPFFWIRALNAVSLFLSYNTVEEDLVALSYLNDIKITTLTPSFDMKSLTIKMGKELSFFFDKNPYFTNDHFTIRMIYRANENGERIGSTGRIKVITNGIDWKVNLLEINSSSFFNVFIQELVNEEDYEILDSVFDNFNTKAIQYFYQFN